MDNEQYFLTVLPQMVSNPRSFLRSAEASENKSGETCALRLAILM